jgi:salicylate hydroxylase
MAAEDGAAVGKLLGLLNTTFKNPEIIRWAIPDILRVFESLRKSWTTVDVQGAGANRRWYHVPDGLLQQTRDTELAGLPLPDTVSPPGWNYVTP